MKLQLRVDDNDEDALIRDCIETATNYAQKLTNRQFISATWDLKLDRLPGVRKDNPAFDNRGNIRPPRPPLQSVTTFAYLDLDGNSQTLAATVYDVDTNSEPGRIYLKYDQSWPSIRSINDAVTITYVCGYGDDPSAVDLDAQHLVKLIAAHLYEERQPALTGSIVATMPLSVQDLAMGLRVPEFA